MRAADANRLNKLLDVVGVERDSLTVVSGREMLPELQAISAPVSHLLRVQSGRHQAKQEVISKQQFGKKEHICVWCVLAALLLCKLWCELMNLPR